MATNLLNHKRIVLGVTGGIAVYKSAILTSRLVQTGALVDVVMTAGAQKFITPLTFQALTHRRVYTDLFDLPAQENIPHIALADEADLLVIAPATANTLAKLANGLADNLLTSIALATPAPILLVPAMETDMWNHPATQANITRLQTWGIKFVGPASGRLASGAIGPGRIVEPEMILDHMRLVLGYQGDLAGLRVVVTAGGTREPIDPVRYITNRSSGKMGFALAEVARDRGARVILISSSDPPPLAGVEIITVNTALELKDAVLQNVLEAEVLLMAAAVADYRPAEMATQKLKKSEDDLLIRLARNPDILAAVAVQRKNTGWPRYTVGFAAETQDLLTHAASKLTRKGLDLIAANDVSRQDAGFGVDTNAVTLLSKDEDLEELPLMSKIAVAEVIWDRIKGADRD